MVASLSRLGVQTGCPFGQSNSWPRFRSQVADGHSLLAVCKTNTFLVFESITVKAVCEEACHGLVEYLVGYHPSIETVTSFTDLSIRLSLAMLPSANADRILPQLVTFC